MTAEALEMLRAAGLAAPGEQPAFHPLAGGVSSEIWRVDLARGPVCVKRALPRLKVAQLWEAPVERNRYERGWLRIAGQASAGCAPRVLAEGDGVFAMEYVEAPVWKEVLRRGNAEPGFACAVGSALAAVHASTRRNPDIQRAFATDSIFHAIRLEPYLVATSRKHTDLAGPLLALAERTAGTRECLVHGDVSPKNILVRPSGPMFLDAECAWYGDPAFDLAFCLNHLLLKCLWVPEARGRFLQCFTALKDAYLRGTAWPDVETRAATLLPGLLLARADGKSPVEYLDETGLGHVRTAARSMLLARFESLDEIRDAWQRSLT